jgi:hypothetical protein
MREERSYLRSITSVKTNAGWNNVTGVEKSYGQGFADYLTATPGARRTALPKHYHE